LPFGGCRDATRARRGQVASSPLSRRKVFVQRLKFRRVAEPGGEGFQSLSRVVLASVEAFVYEGLDAAPQWVEQCRYHEGGDDYGELWLLGLVRQRAEDRLGRRHAPQVDCDQRCREGTVDQREVDDYVDIVESVLQYGEANGYRDSGEFVPSVTTPLYRTTVSRTLRLALQSEWIDDSYPNMARGKYEETIQFGWSTISEIFRSTTRLARM
jgi:hypothetical protein